MIIAAFTAATVRKGSVCVLRQLPVRGTFHLGTQHSSISEKMKKKMIEKQKTKVENLKKKKKKSNIFESRNPREGGCRKIRHHVCWERYTVVSVLIHQYESLFPLPFSSKSRTNCKARAWLFLKTNRQPLP